MAGRPRVGTIIEIPSSLVFSRTACPPMSGLSLPLFLRDGGMLTTVSDSNPFSCQFYSSKHSTQAEDALFAPTVKLLIPCCADNLQNPNRTGRKHCSRITPRHSP